MCDCGQIKTDEGKNVVHEHMSEGELRIGNMYDTFVALWVTDEFRITERPEDCKEAFVLKWKEMGISIPWPEGYTALESVELWREVGLC